MKRTARLALWFAYGSLTLDKLCQDFRDEVFRNAGKEQPPMRGC